MSGKMAVTDATDREHINLGTGMTVALFLHSTHFQMLGMWLYWRRGSPLHCMQLSGTLVGDTDLLHCCLDC